MSAGLHSFCRLSGQSASPRPSQLLAGSSVLRFFGSSACSLLLLAQSQNGREGLWASPELLPLPGRLFPQKSAFLVPSPPANPCSKVSLNATTCLCPGAATQPGRLAKQQGLQARSCSETSHWPVEAPGGQASHSFPPPWCSHNRASALRPKASPTSGWGAFSGRSQIVGGEREIEGRDYEVRLRPIFPGESHIRVFGYFRATHQAPYCEIHTLSPWSLASAPCSTLEGLVWVHSLGLP